MRTSVRTEAPWKQAARFAAACEKAGIIVRPFTGDGVRVSIGTPEENDAFLEVAAKSLTTSRAPARPRQRPLARATAG